MKKLCSLSIVILFILTSFVTVYAYDLVPQEATDTEGLYSEMSFEYHSQEATGEIISIASDNTSLIYILKRITGEKKQIDIYNENGIYCFSVLFETGGACGLIEIDNKVYLYYVRGHFAFLLVDGRVSDSLYYFNDNSGRLAYANYSLNERTYSFGKINMSSGNILLKIFRYNTKVEIITQEENIVICDSTKYCSNQLITMFFLVLIILCIVITGVVYQIRIRQGVRQGTVLCLDEREQK